MDIWDREITCPECNGRGYRKFYTKADSGLTNAVPVYKTITCPKCNGKGKIIEIVRG